MREFINWYDEVSVEQFANAQGLIISTTRYDSEMVMTDQEKTALARILAYEGIHGESGHYFHAVDFLWMAHRISTASKLANFLLLGQDVVEQVGHVHVGGPGAHNGGFGL